MTVKQATFAIERGVGRESDCFYICTYSERGSLVERRFLSDDEREIADICKAFVSYERKAMAMSPNVEKACVMCGATLASVHLAADALELCDACAASKNVETVPCSCGDGSCMACDDLGRVPRHVSRRDGLGSVPRHVSRRDVTCAFCDGDRAALHAEGCPVRAKIAAETTENLRDASRRDWIVLYTSTRRHVTEAWEADTYREAADLRDMLRARGYAPKIYARAAYDAARRVDPVALPEPFDL